MFALLFAAESRVRQWAGSYYDDFVWAGKSFIVVAGIFLVGLAVWKGKTIVAVVGAAVVVLVALTVVGAWQPLSDMFSADAEERVPGSLPAVERVVDHPGGAV